MKIYVPFLILLFIGNAVQAQGGWIFDTNPLNATTGYTTIYNYTGCSFVELNGDQYVDLLASPKSVFLNNGDGTFSNGSTLPYTILNGVSGNSCADLDNDGDQDIIVAGVPSKVFFNNGTGTFTDSTNQLPDFADYGSWGVAIGNYNEDRALDFFFAHPAGFMAPAPTAPCRLFAQTEEIFSVTDLPLPPVTDSLNPYTNPYWSDYDLDGDMDLFVASGPVMGTPKKDFCYKNYKIETGLDSLALMTTELFATQTQDGQCYNFIDYDNDGDFDLCLANYFSAPTRMYKNNGGVYSVITTPFSFSTTNIANCWGDYDNDGDQDVIITNDNQTSRYCRNDGGDTFSYLADGFTTPTATNGIANADYDNDGDLDLFTNGIGNNGNTSSVGLFINDTVAGDRHFINLTLIGTTSNRSAIGAIVKIHATINGMATWQMREVNAQNTFQGQNDLRVHFGLGDANSIDTLIIIWPSGTIDTYYNYPVNVFYQMTEGVGGINLAITETGNIQNVFSVFPNPTSDILHVQVAHPGNSDIKFALTNMLGAQLITGQTSQSKFEIDMKDVSPGVYMLYLLVDGEIAAERVVKY